MLWLVRYKPNDFEKSPYLTFVFDCNKKNLTYQSLFSILDMLWFLFSYNCADQTPEWHFLLLETRNDNES